MYNDFVQLCAQLVPTFKNDNVGKEIPKSIIKERLKTLNNAFRFDMVVYNTFKFAPQKM